MAFLFLALAFAMAAATLIESRFGTSTARALVYNTHWFELLWGLFALNLINNIIRYRFFTTRRLTLGLFHISFIIMILGAAITRYFSYEGIMHIREGESANYILSSDDYFYASLGEQKTEKKVRFSELAPKQFSTKFFSEGQDVKVKVVGFIQNAEKRAIASASGEPVIDLVFSSPGGQGMQSYSLKKGERLSLQSITAGFEAVGGSTISFFMENGQLFMASQIQLDETTMASQETKVHEAGDTIAVQPMLLYGSGDFRFLMRKFIPSATFTAVKSQVETREDAVLVQISDANGQQTVPVFGYSGVIPDTVQIPLDNGIVKLAYGALPLQVPFSIYLKDFQLEHYPGSQSPSSFASEVVLKDEGKGINQDIRIFMNNTLNHRGYKFFQSSYDMDEKGTILSVNHDFWGTWISYLGYTLMILGFITSLVNRGSYFQHLVRKLKESSVKTGAVILFLIGLTFSGNAQTGLGAGIPTIDNNVVKEFSELWVQGVDGRIEPVSTLNSEIVRKITGKSSFLGRNADEVILSMITYPELWRSVPMVKVKNKTLATTLGAQNKYITIESFFDAQGNYKISEAVRAAYAKTPALRNRVEKEYIYVDERVNICYMVLQGSLFHLFPREKKEDTWYSPGANALEYTAGDSLFIKSGFQLLVQSIADKNAGDAVQVLNAVSNFQEKYGSGLLPSESKKKTEILFNKINPFKRIFPFYLLFGFLLLFLLFVNIFRQKPLPQLLRFTFLGLIFLMFLVHTGGLILRWYISGHAPWSNGYESVVYVAWAAMLAGLIFGRKYPMVVGTAAFLSGIALFVAHLSWMNPEVTNLVPVLKSYWLTIHVAVITASYGFIGLSMFLGILVMILMVMRNQINEQKVNGFIEQLTTINEMSATVGLYFLTIGTFLGGIWANESWGRYWGWDPKETWSLITIMIYSFVVHMRLIPSLKGIFNYNFASIIAFSSVLMTYFGVNYYLTGLHSYGKGVADSVNPAFPVAILLLGGLILWAYLKDSKYEKEKL